MEVEEIKVNEITNVEVEGSTEEKKTLKERFKALSTPKKILTIAAGPVVLAGLVIGGIAIANTRKEDIPEEEYEPESLDDSIV